MSCLVGCVVGVVVRLCCCLVWGSLLDCVGCW